MATHLAPRAPYYQDHFAQYGKADVAGAAKLLEDAGYTKGADGIYAKGGKPLSLRISTTAGNQLRETQEQLIQAQLKQVGIDIKIVNADNRKFFGEWLPQGNFDIANFGWVGNPFAISSNQDIYRTGGGGNTASTRATRSTSCSARRSGKVDEAKSAELGNQIDQQLTADMATSRCTPSRPTWPCATASQESADTRPRRPVLELGPVGQKAA